MTVRDVIAEVKAVDDDSNFGSFEAILSAPTKDRDGEIVDAKAFEPLPARIAVDIDHGLSTESTVGSGVPFYDGDTLKIRGTFSSIPRAQEVRALVAEGHVGFMSVAFMAAEREKKDGVPHVTKAELLNATFTPIPSNREAAVVTAKADEKVGARHNKSDADAVQAIGEAAKALGYVCPDCAAGKTAGETEEKETDTSGASPETPDAVRDSGAYLLLAAAMT